MFLPSRTTSMTTLPDLSLQISSTSADSNSSGSDLSHENGLHGFNLHGGFVSHGLHLDEPRLNLGLEMAGFNYHSQHRPILPLELQRNSLFLQHQYGNQHYRHPQIYGHEFKRNSRMGNRVRKIVRAPRMRWTSTLHAHFVHAVELLGGHESML